MKAVLMPSVVASIQASKTIVHIVGYWSICEEAFKRVMETAKQHLQVQGPTETLRIGSAFTNVLNRRGFGCSWFMDGVVEYEDRCTPPSQMHHDEFSHMTEHRPVAFQVTPIEPLAMLTPGAIPPSFSSSARRRSLCIAERCRNMHVELASV